MRKDELREKTRQELLEMARAREIRGRTAMSKEELVSALGSAREPAAPSSPAEIKKPRSRKAQAAKEEPAPEPEKQKRAERPERAERMEAPPTARAPETREDRPPARHAGSETRPVKPSPGRPERHDDSEDPEDEEGRKWNSVALGRDPNYGRFLNPGSVPPRSPAGRVRRPGPPLPPGQQESLAERSERGRIRAVERSHGAYEPPRRNVDPRRGNAYPNRYGRPGEHAGGPRGDRDRPDRVRPERDRPERDRLHGPRPDRNRPADPAGRPRGGPWGGDRDRRPGDRDRRGPDHERRGPDRAPLAEVARPPHRREGGGRDREAAAGRQPRALPPAEERPLLEAPRVQGEYEGFSPDTDQELAQAPNWESLPSAAEAPPRERTGQAGPRPGGQGGTQTGGSRDHPAHYGLDRCRLMVRDPQTIYAYWEIQAQTLAFVQGQIADQWESGTRILRVHGIPISGNPDEPTSNFFDLECGAEAKDWYITVPHPNRAYRVDVGVITTDGLFYPLASSNTVITPRSAPSENGREEWARPPGSTETPSAERAVETGEGAPSEAPSAEPIQTRPVLPESGPGLAPGGPGIPPSSADLIAGSPSSAQAREKGRPAAAGNVFGSANLSGSAILSGSAPTGALLSSSPEGPAPSVGAAKGRGFRFSLNTELIVYGSTEPGARVMVQGTEVPLRADGSFSMRILLPDGTQVLDAVATSSDGQEVKRITPTITRNTTSE